MHEDHDRCYRAVASRDARFDGRFVTAVSTTGIYCRPSCPAQTPKRENVRFYPCAAAAVAAGFRACKRCRPEAAPGSRDRKLDFHAQAGSASAAMGSVLAAPNNAPVAFDVHVANCPGATVHYFLDNAEVSALPPQPVTDADQTLHASSTSDGARHWIRVEVRDADGRLLLFGNPIYFNWPSHPDIPSH